MKEQIENMIKCLDFTFNNKTYGTKVIYQEDYNEFGGVVLEIAFDVICGGDCPHTAWYEISDIRVIQFETFDNLGNEIVLNITDEEILNIIDYGN